MTRNRNDDRDRAVSGDEFGVSSVPPLPLVARFSPRSDGAAFDGETFDEDSVEFARECAAIYCATRANRDAFDDAVQDAFVLIAEAEADGRPRPSKTSVVGALIRAYQKERGLRRKSPPRRVDLDVESVASAETEPTPDVETDGRKKLRAILDRAARQPELAPYRDVLDALRSGATGREVAAARGLSPGRVSQILALVKSVCSRLVADARVEIVDPKDAPRDDSDREKNPLFYA